MSEQDTSAQPFLEDPPDTPAHNRDADRGEPVDPTATGPDVARIEREIEGWGGGSMPEHELTAEQAEHLQDRPEPIGAGETGRTLHGDHGNADPTWQAEAPETVEPDTSLGQNKR
jgi:hypothetical protein